MSGPLLDRWTALQAELPTTARLLAVSKGHPAEAIRALADAGQRDFGESRVQEARPKQELLADLSLRWHFIGRLQSNKVRSVVRAFPVIHSVDSLPLAQGVADRWRGRATAGGAAAGQAAARCQQRRFPAGRAALCLVRAAISAIDECGWPDDHGPDGLRSRRPTGPVQGMPRAGRPAGAGRVLDGDEWRLA